MKENTLTKKGTPRISKKGRKQIYIDDVGVTLSVQVPSKQKEIFRKLILELRNPYEKNNDVFMDISQIPKELLTDEFIKKLRQNGIKLINRDIKSPSFEIAPPPQFIPSVDKIRYLNSQLEEVENIKDATCISVTTYKTIEEIIKGSEPF